MIVASYLTCCCGALHQLDDCEGKGDDVCASLVTTYLLSDQICVDLVAGTGN